MLLSRRLSGLKASVTWSAPVHDDVGENDDGDDDASDLFSIDAAFRLCGLKASVT